MMKTNLFLTGLSMVLILGSCVSGNYLPRVDEIGENNRGSKINVERLSGQFINGELIALDSSQLFVLADTSGEIYEIPKQIVVIPIKEIESFRLIYAKHGLYWVTIPVFTASTVAHGFFFVFSTPINLLVTTMASLVNIPLQYDDTQLSYENLKMFARFPQGIPPGIDIGQIK